MKRNAIAIATAFALGLGGAGTALAQQAPPPPPPAQQAAPPQIGDKDLEKFAKAQHEVIQIREDFNAKAQAKTEAEELQALQMEANQEMTAAVEDAGLDVQSYNQIAMAVQSDPSLQGKIEQLMGDLE